MQEKRTLWNSSGADGILLLRLFDQHAANPRKGADPNNTKPKYINKFVWDKVKEFNKYKPKNFYIVYHSLAKKWNIEHVKAGARKGK